MNKAQDFISILRRVKEASYRLSGYDHAARNEALEAVADAIRQNQDLILQSNELDCRQAAHLSPSMLDRLRLDAKRVEMMCLGVREVALQRDVLDEVLSECTLKNGLKLIKKRVALGVVGIIYEARPNVSSDAIALCIKTGNALVLKGGKEAINTNSAIVQVCQNVLKDRGFSAMAESIALVHTNHQQTLELMKAREWIDILIPRGSSALIHAVVENARIPVIETGSGNCHIFVDESCDFVMAKEVILNAKLSRPSVCNSMEKLLVHELIAPQFLSYIIPFLRAGKIVLKADKKTNKILSQAGLEALESTQDSDLYEEYLGLKMSIFSVADVDSAIAHINRYGSHHSDCILSSNQDHINQFIKEVDSAVVYANASTRFSDGGEFGLGAEIGISTQKLHARGPMGAEALTTYKYCVLGEGQVR